MSEKTYKNADEYINRSRPANKDADGRVHERLRLQQRVIQKIMSLPAIKGKRLDIITGLPGAGKLFVIGENLLRLYGGRLIDSNAIKELLPEYEGGRGSNFLSQESSNILKIIVTLSLAAGDNMVWPTVGENYGSLIKKIRLAKDSGYKVYLHHVEITPEASLFSVLTRAFPGEEGKPYGPYIPIEYLQELGNKPNEVFERLKREGVIPDEGE